MAKNRKERRRQARAERKQDKQVQRHPNRNSRTDRGNQQIMEDAWADRQDYNLGNFQPKGKQQDIVHFMHTVPLTLVQGRSGTGKTSTAVWQALSFMKQGRYKRTVFIKTPSEDGDDKIGYVKGDEKEKLEGHMRPMKTVFLDFMSEAKLESEIKHKRITFDIPNKVAGMTWKDYTILIIDESQKMSSLKVLLERVDDTCLVVVLGDKSQTYSVNKRKDGFTQFVKMTTAVDEEGRYSDTDMIGYVEMTSDDNMRGKLSQLVDKLYEKYEEEHPDE